MRVFCGKCGTVLVMGNGDPRPYGLCRVCLEAGLYRARREFERKTSAWIRKAKANVLTDAEEDVFRGFR